MKSRFKLSLFTMHALRALLSAATASALLLSGCVGQAGQAAASEIPASTDAALTLDPSAEPETVDLSEYEEMQLPQLEPVAEGEEIAVVQTSLGAIKLRFFPDLAPKAVQNFKTHAKAGYYNGTIFHRVINEFMIQGGDPEGTGTGGESIFGAPFELETSPSLHHLRGALSMARTSDPVSQGSQFFIVQNKALSEEVKAEMEEYKNIQNQVVFTNAEGTKIPIAVLFPLSILDKYISEGGVPQLDFQYTVFGQVIEGLDTVDSIAGVETSTEESTQDKPLTDVLIESITFEPYTQQ
ncbi:MAG: peptidylprolyl isomerase [Clostridiales bacterium]|jgi:cyclophilin family peptidyl-prolyl cis-trans isomerase|nr:peptidylprolyl isomerase [Clostridiales bacterium]